MNVPFVLPVVSVMLAEGERLDPVEDALNEMLGPVELRSDPYPFDLSDYYRPEMGEGIRRIWLCFGRLRDPSELPGWKLGSAMLEEGFSSGGCRRINLDPGYLDHGKLVLASFKEAPDKIYIGSGVWAHTCLRYRFSGFTAPDHSFPDFRDGRFDAFMLQARGVYRTLLKDLRKTAISPSAGT